MRTVLLSSGTKTFFFCRFGYLLFLPVGLNLVARVRLEYPPPTTVPLFEILHTLVIFLKIYSINYLRGEDKEVLPCYHRIYMNAIFYIAILVMSVVIHEISHGFMAEYYGDKTARLAERLTLNPISHLDLFGSILLPAFLILSHAPFLVGWAKPVPYNPYNLRDRRKGELAVASAGVLANFAIAIFFGLILRFALIGNVSQDLVTIVSLIVLTNLGLGIFNLVPIPPLDGSKIFYNLLPSSVHKIIAPLEKYSLIFIVVFIVFFSSILYPILSFFFHLITGLTI